MPGRDWTIDENREIVADYFEMLKVELSGKDYVKAEHRRASLPKLNDRNHSSVEFKHGNISAVLNNEFNMPYIIGYKPYPKY